MTKVVIKGPAAGTGSYTLNAPETASDLSLELPITGTHLASAQADGMPLGPDGDPVVESGSNSDGEWTRFADGTQLCWGNRDYNGITTAAGNVFKSSVGNWTFPAVFVGDSSSIKCGCEDSSATTIWGSSRADSTTQANFQTHFPTSLSGTRTSVLSASGRWK